MPTSNARRLAVCVALVAGFAQAASAADILIAGAKLQPESLTVAPGGVLIMGSASSPFVHKVPAGDTLWIAERGAGKAVSIPMPK